MIKPKKKKKEYLIIFLVVDIGIQGKLFNTSNNKLASVDDHLNLWSIPLCFMISFAVWRDLIFPSTVKYLFVIGLYQISWSPLPCRTKVQPLSLSASRTFFSYSAIGRYLFVPFRKKRNVICGGLLSVQLNQFRDRVFDSFQQRIS